MTKGMPVILDTDIGTDIDDMWALAMLLGCPELVLQLVLTCCGDTAYRTNLTAKFLDVVGRTDIPIGRGISDPSNEQFNLKFQEPWLSDFNPSRFKGKIINEGIRYLIECINQSEEVVTIISIGATTNIADALDKESAIADKCRFIGMHGSIHSGYGGHLGPVPETNVRLDPAAFRKIISAQWREIIITPSDTCGSVVLKVERY